MRRVPLPIEMCDAPFIPRLSGLPAKRVRAADLDKSIYGVRLAGRADDLRTRCAMVALRLRDDAFFSHITAALLFGAPLSLAHERARTLHVGVAGHAPPPHARGILGHHLELQPGDLVLSEGLRVTSPARTWCDLAAVLCLEDLVAVGDFLIRRDLPLTTREAIRTRIWAMVGRRGVRLAREAVELLSDRSESRPESWLRVIIACAGMPDPEINHVLIDSENGKQVRPDFLFRAQRLILEYQGDYHRTKAQWRKDMTRRSQLEAQGWYVMELNWHDLQNSTELIARIRTVLTRRG